MAQTKSRDSAPKYKKGDFVCLSSGVIVRLDSDGYLKYYPAQQKEYWVYDIREESQYEPGTGYTNTYREQYIKSLVMAAEAFEEQADKIKKLLASIGISDVYYSEVYDEDSLSFSFTVPMNRALDPTLQQQTTKAHSKGTAK